jgi:hypothetical protein
LLVGAGGLVIMGVVNLAVTGAAGLVAMEVVSLYVEAVGLVVEWRAIDTMLEDTEEVSDLPAPE